MMAAFGETTMATNLLREKLAAHLLRGAFVFVALVVHPVGAGATADREREQRWAAQIVPAIVVGEAIYLPTPSQPRVLALYTEVAQPKGGVIVVHGAGMHPDWGLNGALRGGLADAGFATLSAQMPVLAATATRDDYVALFPEAAERIAAAIAFLRERGIDRVAVVAHSMGAAMVGAYLARPGGARIDAWVPIGMATDFGGVPKEPVLDISAESDFADVREALARRLPQLPHDACSGQLVIAGTDHYMENRQGELVTAIATFLQRALAGRC
jgi:pimeloyl-ACP methyl ester carboxylesterase